MTPFFGKHIFSQTVIAKSADNGNTRMDFKSLMCKRKSEENKNVSRLYLKFFKVAKRLFL